MSELSLASRSHLVVASTGEFIWATARRWWLIVPGLVSGALGAAQGFGLDLTLPTWVYFAISAAAWFVAAAWAYHDARVARDDAQVRLTHAIRQARSAPPVVREGDDFQSRVQRHVDRVEEDLKRENERKQELVRRLRQEYLASHDGLSPAMLAGTEPLPKEWVDGRLEELGERWRWNRYMP